MANDDLELVAFKILEYVYACMKQGVRPSNDQALNASGVKKAYFLNVIRALIDEDLIAGVEVRDYYDGTSELSGTMRVTLKGAGYIRDNSTMGKIRTMLGSPWAEKLVELVTTTTLI